MVIEERNLIFPAGADKTKRDIYYQFYSVNHLRKLCEKPYLTDQRYNDLWIALKNTFYLFESEAKAKHLGLSPIAGDLFGYNAIDILNQSNLDNKVLLVCLRNLSVFINKNTGQKMRINYASLNVEEFGSVYEGLLEYAPVITKQNGTFAFDLVKGSERSSSGSHYTPDELVQPLIKHSLDYVIQEKLESSDKKSKKEEALLSIKVCDVACGSGHILLNAARRIGTELAKVRTSEDQPSPAPLRQAIRDVIKSCIYGVDVNPLAVELCKVALWLEAHNPGEPLNFLDHHIKCGDAIVGLAHKEELENGIADEAFKKMPDDDKEIRTELAKRNKRERKDKEQRHFDFGETVDGSFSDISKMFAEFNALPENSILEIEQKRREYEKMTSGANWLRLKTLADIQVAQFFIPKNESNAKKIVTDEEYMDYLSGIKAVHGLKAGKAGGLAAKKKYFHWYLEFPVVFSHGGFDCILGNPPFLGGQKLSGTFGNPFLNFIKYYYKITGSCDLITYFYRRIYGLIKSNGFHALISTNSISQGTARENSLDIITRESGIINFAATSVRWPGSAEVVVTLLAIHKGAWIGLKYLNNQKVSNISSNLDDQKDSSQPAKLQLNENISFMGSTVVGQGFILEPSIAIELIKKDNRNKDVIFPYLNGLDLNSSPIQHSKRFIINFSDWPIERAKEYSDCFRIIEEKVKPERQTKSYSKNTRDYWWRFHRPTKELYDAIAKLNRVLVVAQVSKTVAFCFVDKSQVFDAKLIVFATDAADFFCLIQSSFHFHWAWKYCTTMKNDLSYGPTRIFETFPFPIISSREITQKLKYYGDKYHEFRKKIMFKTQLGLTKIYNQFHNPDLKKFSKEDINMVPSLKTKDFQKKYGKETFNLRNHLKKTEGVCTFNEAVEDILQLRNLHKQMDEMVLRAYGLENIDLAHDFYEVDYLPENDRIRYTISTAARKEILKRLLKLNHEIHDHEQKEGKLSKVKTKKKKSKETKGHKQLQFDIK